MSGMNGLTEKAYRVEANPDLFRPKTPVVLPAKEKAEPEPSTPGILIPPPGPAKPEAPPTSTTGRLLEAKRRARKKLE